MRKYRMCLGWKYRLKNFFTIEKYWSGKIIAFRILCEYGFDIDLREGGFKITDLLNKKEKSTFACKIFGHKFNRSIQIYNQIKPITEPMITINCKRCGCIVESELICKDCGRTDCQCGFGN